MATYIHFGINNDLQTSKKMEQKICKSSANNLAQLHYDPDDIACSGRWSSRTEKVYCSLVGFRCLISC